MLYWNYLHGTFLFYSYGDESFSFWNHPKILATLFATHNGHILYNPIFLIILSGITYMIVKKKKSGYLFAMIFILLTYMTASWHDYAFGCGFAGRNFVEYYAIFSIPLGFFISNLKSLYTKVIGFAFLGIFTIYNIALTYRFDECWFGNGI